MMFRALNYQLINNLRPGFRGLWAALIVAGGLFGAHATAFAAETVVVRAGEHADFGRIVLDLPRAMKYEARANGNRIEIEFDAPVEAAFDDVTRVLGDYVREISLDGENTIVATLTGPHRMRDFVNERSIVIDLRKAAGSAARGDIPAVATRFGRHSNFTRLVFDWSSNVGYRVANNDGDVTMRFSRAADIRFKPADVRAARGFASASAAPEAGKSTVVHLDVDGRIRHFRDGLKVVVDVFDTAGSANKVAAAPPTKTPSKAQVAPPKPSSQEAAAARGPVSLVSDANAATSEAIPVEPTSPRSEATLAVSAPIDLRPPAMVPAPRILDRLADDVAALEIEVEAELDGALIRFPFTEPTGAALFRRGGRLWVVFDRVVRIDTEQILAAASEFVRDVEQVPHERATVLRLTTIPGFNALSVRDGAEWEIVLAPQLLKPEVAMDVMANIGSVPSVTVGPTLPGTPVGIVDPEVGDEIQVVPVRETGDGVAQRHAFPDFRLLVSIQGVAIVPVSDRVDVRAGDDRVIITAVGGLRLTDASARSRVLAAGPDDDIERLFRFVEWRHAELGEYAASERELLAQVGKAEPADRNTARLELARFYLAYGLADRAIGLIDVMVKDAPEMDRVPTLRALRGAARFVMGDVAGAERDLFDRELDLEPELELWRTAIRGAQGDTRNASIELQTAERFVQDYPDSLRARFGFLGAELSLAAHDPVASEFWLEVIGDANLTPAETDRRRVLKAGIAAQNGEVDTAITLYDRTINGRDRLSRALAVLEKTELLLSEEDMSPAEAVEALDGLRYVWRGDTLEFRILRRLGELELAAGEYRDGLRTLKRAASNFPEHPQAPVLADEMRTLFERLYMDGEANDLAPITAIALFNEFRELVPAGAPGDAMIRRLADRLVAVDLLDQAAELLAHQVEFRLEGAEKADIGVRLAMVQLLNRNPELALKALDDSTAGGLPAALMKERQVAASRARTQLGEYDRALAWLDGLTGEEVDLLRAEIHWRSQDWKAAARVFARLAGPLPGPEDTLDSKHSRYVMNRAVALALAGESNRLTALALTYGAAMAETPFGADFRVLTAVETAPRDFAEVLKRVAKVDDFQAFMDSYRARLAEAPDASPETAGS
jgi:tetratricopeptide (TPR) repeat protein